MLVLGISGNNSRFDDWHATQVQPLELYDVRVRNLQLVNAKSWIEYRDGYTHERANFLRSSG